MAETRSSTGVQLLTESGRRQVDTGVDSTQHHLYHYHHSITTAEYTTNCHRYVQRNSNAGNIVRLFAVKASTLGNKGKSSRAAQWWYMMYQWTQTLYQPSIVTLLSSYKPLKLTDRNPHKEQEEKQQQQRHKVSLKLLTLVTWLEMQWNKEGVDQSLRAIIIARLEYLWYDN